MHLFQPKHQKLILQCYPPGRGFDKKPNSSELSYLLYYASTRRVKLEKVGKYLQKKNESDVYRNRTGNVQVTLEIIDALIKKCPDDLNVFASSVNVILKSVLKTKDLSLCQHAEPVFHTYCSTLDVELFTGDLDFVRDFTELSESFLNLGVNVSAANTVEWKTISLKVAGSLANWKTISLNNSSLFIIKKAISLICSEILQDFTEENLMKRTISHLSENQQQSSERLSQDLTRLNSIKYISNKRELSDTQSPHETDLDDLAIRSLENYFNTTSSTKLNSSTIALMEYLINANVNQTWSAALIELIITWVPVQLRFIVLSILTARLDKNGDKSGQSIYIHSISTLLSSSVNLVGLSIIDNLKQFINLQGYYILNTNNEHLIVEYTNAIESLATHIYYQDQIIDIVGELLTQVKDTDNFQLILALLDGVDKVLKRAFKSRSVQRSLVPIELFADTFYLVHSEDAAVQKSYLRLLVTDLELEYKEKVQYLKPDYEGLISSAKGSVLNLFYEQTQLITKLPSKEEFLALLELINLKFGINTAVDFIPFFFHFQLKETEHKYTEQEILLDNIGYANIYFASKSNGLDEILDELSSRIQYRIEKNLWVFDSFPNFAQIPSASSLILTKQRITELILTSSLSDFQETILSTHYRYNLSDIDHPEVEISEEIGNAKHLISAQNTSQSFGAFLKSPGASILQVNNDTNSIRSMPFSARSLLVNGKLNVPKVHELRNAVSGARSTRVVTGPTTAQKTDAVTLLDELTLESELEDRGRLVHT